MPELPDVAGFQQYFDATALHQPISHVELHDAERLLKGITASKFRRQLQGHAFVGTRRHGKYLFANMDGGGWLVMHFGMTGGLNYHRRAGDRPPYARVVAQFEGGPELSYQDRRKLGRLTIAPDADAFIEAESLGPDALDAELDGNWFRDALANRTGPIKAVLMDQKLVAGIGNVYADEILFQSGIGPDAKAADVGSTRADRLAHAVSEVLKVTAEARGRIDLLPDSYLLSHRDGDGRCPGCDGEIATMRVNGRVTRYCPRCQD